MTDIHIKKRKKEGIISSYLYIYKNVSHAESHAHLKIGLPKDKLPKRIHQKDWQKIANTVYCVRTHAYAHCGLCHLTSRTRRFAFDKSKLYCIPHENRFGWSFKQCGNSYQEKTENYESF